MPIHEHHDLRERRVAPAVIENFAEVWRRSWEDFSYRAGALTWDASWRAPLLEEFASHHDDTAFPAIGR